MLSKSDPVTRDTGASTFASLWRPREVLKRDGIARNNAISVFLMGALPAMGGSAISVLLSVFFVWGIISLVFGRFPPRLSHSDRVIAWTFTIFVASVLITGLIGEDQGRLWRHAIWLLPFLSLWIVIPRMRASSEIDYLATFVAGAAIGAVIAGLYVLAHWIIAYWLGGGRPSGGAGNALVFAQMCLLLGAIASLNITAVHRNLRWLALCGLLFGLIAAIFTLSRGVWLAAIPLVFLIFLHALPAWRWLVARPVVWMAAAIAFALAIYGSAERMLERIGRLWSAMDGIDDFVVNGEHSEERFRLWEAALGAIAESPVWGYGIQNRMEALFVHYPDVDAAMRGFSHAHSGYLSAMLDGGVVVLAATIALLAVPVLIAWRAPHDEDHRRRLFLALFLSVGYATVGLANIMFRHDIIDAFFIFTVIVIAGSIPNQARRDNASNGRRP